MPTIPNRSSAPDFCLLLVESSVLNSGPAAGWVGQGGGAVASSERPWRLVCWNSDRHTHGSVMVEGFVLYVLDKYMIVICIIWVI